MKKRKKSKNIQIVKIQIDNRVARKKLVKRTKRTKRTTQPFFKGTGLVPITGETQFNFPNQSRAGTQFEKPDINRMVDPEWFRQQKEYIENLAKSENEKNQRDMRESLDQLQRQQDYAKRKGEMPSPFNQPTFASGSPFVDPFYQVYRFSDTPRESLVQPQQPLVSAQASSASSAKADIPDLVRFREQRDALQKQGKFGYKPAKK